MDIAVAERYGQVRDELENIGQVIGPFDLRIAATALVHDLTVVTHNVDEFSRVDGLRIEEWFRGWALCAFTLTYRSK